MLTGKAKKEIERRAYELMWACREALETGLVQPIACDYYTLDPREITAMRWRLRIQFEPAGYV